METKLLLTTIAANEYSCGAYGEGAFGECATASTTNPDNGTGTSGGGLADTGYDIILPLALGLSVVVASVILLVKRLRRSRSGA